MTALNDAKLNALKSALGVTNGSIDDLEMEFLQAVLGATAASVDDMWMQVFRSALLVTDGQHNTLAAAWLRSLGHTQADINAQWLSYWSSIS